MLTPPPPNHAVVAEIFEGVRAGGGGGLFNCQKLRLSQTGGRVQRHALGCCRRFLGLTTGFSPRRFLAQHGTGDKSRRITHVRRVAKQSNSTMVTGHTANSTTLWRGGACMWSCNPERARRATAVCTWRVGEAPAKQKVLSVLLGRPARPRSPKELLGRRSMPFIFFYYFRTSDEPDLAASCDSCATRCSSSLLLRLSRMRRKRSW